MKVLLVKLSSLGDVVHAMPALQDIRRAVPGAEIDWVVEAGFASLVRHCEGVRRVIESDQRGWRKSPLSSRTRREWRAFKSDLQAEAYDAVIDLQGLTKSALVAWLARLAPGGKRYALGNQTEGAGYEKPTRWVADVAIPMEPHIHAVQRSRELCARALGYEVPQTLFYGLQVEPAREPDGQSRAVAFVHGTSRADKLWPDTHWIALGRRLVHAGYTVAMLHGNAEEQARSERLANALGPQATVWPRLALDALTQRMAGTAGVIGVDSGLSHIAVALDLPHVQLYNFDTAWRTGPLPLAGPGRPMRQVSVYARPTPSADSVWHAWQTITAS